MSLLFLRLLKVSYEEFCWRKYHEDVLVALLFFQDSSIIPLCHIHFSFGSTEARRLALEESRPVLIEAMTYRVGHHSSSDDSTRYRSADEIKEAKSFDPITRVYNHLESQGWWNETDDTELTATTRKEILKAMEVAERRPPVPQNELFNDVYDKLPKHLQEQEESFRIHMNKYNSQYPK